MLKLGIVGTSFISHDFITAALLTKDYVLEGIYSRTKSRGDDFLKTIEKNVPVYHHWEEFLAADLDVIYLASPNSVHFSQAMDCLKHHKNIIVEKPAFTSPEEFNQVITLANENNLFYFEAARHIHEPGFKKLQEQLPNLGEIIGGSFTYAKYSSRYDLVLKGEEPNIFSLKYAGGALMDLGVYLIYAAVALFGLPEKSSYTCQKIATGVDGYGTAVLTYENFQVTFHCGKIMDSKAPNEIYTKEGTFILPKITGIEEISYFSREKKTIWQQFYPMEYPPMYYEAKDFSKVMLHPENKALGKDYEEWVELSRNVNTVLDHLQKSGHLNFKR